MSQIKQIPLELWMEHLSLFTNGNKGRKVSLKLFDQQEGDYLLSENKPLLAIDYDPVSKGNDIIILLGEKNIEYTHTVPAPVELRETHDYNGQVQSLEIIDQNRNRIVLDLNS